jgi:hypothetical protein
MVTKKLLYRSEERILYAILGLWRQKLSAKTTSHESTNHVPMLEIRIEIAFRVEFGLAWISIEIIMEIINILNGILTGLATILKTDPWFILCYYCDFIIFLIFWLKHYFFVDKKNLNQFYKNLLSHKFLFHQLIHWIIPSQSWAKLSLWKEALGPKINKKQKNASNNKVFCKLDFFQI